jgi:hypothetical protein
MGESEIKRRLDDLFDRISRMTDTELVMLRSVWEEEDSAAREEAWQQVKAVVRAHRRQAMLDDARSELAVVLTGEVPPVGVVGVATFPSNPAGLARSAVRTAAMPPLLDAIAATIAADGLDGEQETLLLEPVSRLARPRAARGSADR